MNDDLPAYVNAGYEPLPIYDEEFAGQLRDILRPHFPYIDELSTPELVEFFASQIFTRK